MNRIEKNSATTATARSRTSRGRVRVLAVGPAPLELGQRREGVGTAAVMPVISTRVVNTVAPLAPM